MERAKRCGAAFSIGWPYAARPRGPARVPVVFKLAETAQEAVLASAPVRLQADAGGAPVVFETERMCAWCLVGWISWSASTPMQDAFYLPPPGLSDLKPLEPLPTEWQLKSFAAAGRRNKLQLDPETGLAAEMMVLAGGQQYRLIQVDKDIATIDPPLAGELPAGSPVRKVTTFGPFDGVARNRQEHALYLGHNDLLNLESEATIDVVGAQSLGESVKWQYWGKASDSEEPGWQPLTLADQQKSDAVVLMKPAGAIEPEKIGGISSRWIRAHMPKVEGNAPLLDVDAIDLRINCQSTQPACPTVGDEPPSPEAEAMANTTPLVLDNTFFPLGKEPRQFDAFYLGSKEAFSKKDAAVQLCFELADPSFQALSAVRRGTFINQVAAGVGRDSGLHLFASDATTGSLRPLHDRDPLRPPLPGFFGTTPPGDGVVLDSEPSWRLPVFTEPGFAGFLVGATAGDSIWVWVERPSKDLSGWFPFGELPPDTAGSSPPIDGLVFLRASARMVALRDGKLFARDWPFGPPWTEVTVTASGNPVTLEVLAPIFALAVQRPHDGGRLHGDLGCRRGISCDAGDASDRGDVRAAPRWTHPHHRRTSWLHPSSDWPDGGRGGERVAEKVAGREHRRDAGVRTRNGHRGDRFTRFRVRRRRGDGGGEPARRRYSGEDTRHLDTIWRSAAASCV